MSTPADTIMADAAEGEKPAEPPVKAPVRSGKLTSAEKELLVSILHYL